MSTLIIPTELLNEILKFLPIKSLLRFKSVSKYWFNLISDPYFIHSHLNLSLQNNKFNLLIQSASNIFNIFNFPSTDVYQPKQLTLPCYSSNHSVGIIVGSLNGIICFTNYEQNMFGFLNPSTKHYIQSPPVQCIVTPPSLDTWVPKIGFGYTSKTDEYKVVRFEFLIANQIEVYVYTLGTNSSWRRLTTIELASGSHTSSIATFLNGSLHWPLRTAAKSLMILSFDLASEEFSYMEWPPVVSGFIENLLVLKGCLCVFDYFLTRGGDQTIKIWVMKEYGVNDSWTIQFTMVVNLTNFRPLKLWPNGELLLLNRDWSYVLLDPTRNIKRELTIPGLCKMFHYVDYVESLVPVKR